MKTTATIPKPEIENPDPKPPRTPQQKAALTSLILVGVVLGVLLEWFLAAQVGQWIDPNIGLVKNWIGRTLLAGLAGNLVLLVGAIVVGGIGAGLTAIWQEIYKWMK